MNLILQVIIPVFLVIGFGYLAVWQKWFPDSGVEILMKFTQNFAIPCLLFRAVSVLDLQQTFNIALLSSFYFGAICGFCFGLLGARLLFKRNWENSVAIGFCCLFSNAVLLGLPITERAYGIDALSANFAIIALHAPIAYFIGITTMELIHGKSSSVVEPIQKVLRSMFKNALVISLVLGFFVNLLEIPLPIVAAESVDFLANAALPVALFGLGGVLVRYRPAGDLRVILYICLISLIVHPSLVWITGNLFNLSETEFRSAILTSAMAPGINTYLFANMYGSARRVAASAVLISTALTVVTASFWLFALG